MTPLCIYHGNCADGFGAAWAVWKALGPDEVEFHAGVYGDDPPDVTGREVILVDFSYKRAVLDKMEAVTKSILILDHHKSAAEDLAEYPEPPTDIDGVIRGWGPDSGVYALFDMERSGAGIAWDYFHFEPRPKLIDHIEDRDLWRFKLDGTREIQAAVFSYEYDFDVWDALILRTDLDDLRLEGVAIERKHHKDIAELVGVTKRYMMIGGHYVPVANLPYTLTSDAGHLMCEAESLTLARTDETGGIRPPSPFAACYWDTPEARVFSLRSIGDFDVSEIAKQYGGGGHKNASGFRVAYGDLAQFEGAA